MPPRSGAPAAPLATATVSRRRSEVSTATPPRASATRAALEAPSARSFTAAALGRARRSTGVRGCALRPLPRRRRRRPPVASSRPRVWRCTTWWSSRTPGLAGTPPAGTSPASRTPTSTPSPARPGTFWWESRRRPKSGRGAVCRPRAAPPAVPGGPCPLSSSWARSPSASRWASPRPPCALAPRCRPRIRLPPRCCESMPRPPLAPGVGRPSKCTQFRFE
mmetsp:Transcript_17850/g.42322  ORF Transcript_17850/g.42322 Transcript_17850/m.42322 type:complete len:221 (-) Transcript_17850:125-787(-)